jgi:hypothetical protein
MLTFVEKVLGSSGLSVLAQRDNKWQVVLLNIMQQLENSLENFRTILFVVDLFRNVEGPFCIAYNTGSRPASVLGLDSIPGLLKDLLHLLQSVEG